MERGRVDVWVLGIAVGLVATLVSGFVLLGFSVSEGNVHAPGFDPTPLLLSPVIGIVSGVVAGKWMRRRSPNRMVSWIGFLVIMFVVFGWYLTMCRDDDPETVRATEPTATSSYCITQMPGGLMPQFSAVGQPIWQV